MIAFKIRKETVKGKSRAVVYVSRVFACDEEPGNFIALLALMNHSVNELVLEKTRKKETRDLYKLIAQAFVDNKLHSEVNSTGGFQKPGSGNEGDSDVSRRPIPGGQYGAQQAIQYFQKSTTAQAVHRAWTTRNTHFYDFRNLF